MSNSQRPEFEQQDRTQFLDTSTSAASNRFRDEYLDLMRANTTQNPQRNTDRVEVAAVVLPQRQTDSNSPTSDSPAPILAAPRDVLTASQAREAISSLSSNNYHTRQAATNLLRDSVPESLPHIAQALENRPADLEARRRLEQIDSSIRSQRMPDILNALSHSDRNVRTAARDIVNSTRSDQLLSLVGRENMTPQQTEAVRSTLLNRNSPEELARIYSKPSGDNVHAAVGFARIFDRVNEPWVSGEAGRRLMERGGDQNLADAARLLETASRSNDADTRFNGLRDLTTTRALQNNPGAFNEALARFRPELQRAANNPNMNDSVHHSYRQIVNGLAQSMRTPLPEQVRAQMEQLHSRLQTEYQQYSVTHPLIERSGKKN